MCPPQTVSQNLPSKKCACRREACVCDGRVYMRVSQSICTRTGSQGRLAESVLTQSINAMVRLVRRRFAAVRRVRPRWPWLWCCRSCVGFVYVRAYV